MSKPLPQVIGYVCHLGPAFVVRARRCAGTLQHNSANSSRRLVKTRKERNEQAALLAFVLLAFLSKCCGADRSVTVIPPKIAKGGNQAMALIGEE